MSDFKAKMHQIRFPLGFRAPIAPADSLAVFKGPTSKGREGKGERGRGKEGERKGKGRVGEGREGMGRGRRGSEGNGSMHPLGFSKVVKIMFVDKT